MITVLETIKSAQFVVDATGKLIAVQLSSKIWQALLDLVEQSESVPTVEELTASNVNRDGDGASDTDLAMLADCTLVTNSTRLSEPSLAKVWDNPEDDIYNDL